MKTPN